MKNCLSAFNFFPVSFFPVYFVQFDRKSIEAEENLNDRLNKVEHKFGNIQIAFDFLSILILRDHSEWRANKNKRGEG